MVVARVNTERMIAFWLDACRMMCRAISERTVDAWRQAAVAWDALSAMQTVYVADRGIYQRLAVACWMKVGATAERKSHD